MKFVFVLYFALSTDATRRGQSPCNPLSLLTQGTVPVCHYSAAPSPFTSIGICSKVTFCAFGLSFFKRKARLGSEK